MLFLFPFSTAARGRATERVWLTAKLVDFARLFQRLFLRHHLPPVDPSLPRVGKLHPLPIRLEHLGLQTVVADASDPGVVNKVVPPLRLRHAHPPIISKYMRTSVWRWVETFILRVPPDYS